MFRLTGLPQAPWRAWLVLLLAAASTTSAAQAAPDRPLMEAVIETLAARPAADEIPVHLHIAAETFWPRRLIVRVDGRVARRLRFGPATSRALAAHGVMQVFGVPRDAGRVSFELQLSRSADPAAAVKTVRERTLLRKELNEAAALDLILRRSIWRAWSPVLAAEPMQRIVPAHVVADARLKLAAGEALAAAVALQRLAEPRSGEALLLLGDARQALALSAEDQWRAAAARDGAQTRAQAALRLAEAEQAAQRPNEARYWLSRADAGLAEGELPRWQALRLAMGLVETATLDDDALGWGAVALASYNAVTATAGPRALAELERLGALTMRDELGWSVRDHANLALGYRYLRQRLPDQARSAFARVRAQGPFSAAGRLGLGWAQITPGGGNSYAMDDAHGPRPALRPRGEQALAAARRATPFRTASGVAHGTLAERLQRALAPWTDLIGADPLDPAVQEAMLAIPYALAHLGAHDDAWQRIRQSIVTLQGLQRALDQVATEWPDSRLAAMFPLASGAWPAGFSALGGPRWWRQSQWPEDFFMSRLLSEPPIQQQLDACRQLATARDAVREESLETSLGTALTQCRLGLISETRQVLGQWRDSVSAYLGEAHLAAARMHDSGRPALAAGREAP